MNEPTTLDSAVDFKIPQEGLEVSEYRNWLEQEIIVRWLVEVEDNPEYSQMSTGEWNYEGGLFARFGGEFHMRELKFYKFDGERANCERGILIRAHYSPSAFRSVQFVSDRLESFLQANHISYTRINRTRRL